MLDICVWIVRGRQYLEDFSLRRETANKALGSLAGDCFHDGRQPHPDLSIVVQDEISALLDDVRVSDRITEKVLGITRAMLKPDPKLRPTAYMVLGDIENAIKSAKQQCNAWYTRTRPDLGSTTSRRRATESTQAQSQEGGHGSHDWISSPTTMGTPLTPLSYSSRWALPFPDEWYGDAVDGFVNSSKEESSGTDKPIPLTCQTSPEIVTSVFEENDEENPGLRMGRPHALSAPKKQNPALLMTDDHSQHPGEDQTLAAEHPEMRRSYESRRNGRSRRHHVPYLSWEDAIKWKTSQKSILGRRMTLGSDHFRKWLENRDHVRIRRNSGMLFLY